MQLQRSATVGTVCAAVLKTLRFADLAKLPLTVAITDTIDSSMRRRAAVGDEVGVTQSTQTQQRIGVQQVDASNVPRMWAGSATGAKALRRPDGAVVLDAVLRPSSDMRAGQQRPAPTSHRSVAIASASPRSDILQQHGEDVAGTKRSNRFSVLDDANVSAALRSTLNFGNAVSSFYETVPASVAPPYASVDDHGPGIRHPSHLLHGSGGIGTNELSKDARACIHDESHIPNSGDFTVAPPLSRKAPVLNFMGRFDDAAITTRACEGSKMMARLPSAHGITLKHGADGQSRVPLSEVARMAPTSTVLKSSRCSDTIDASVATRSEHHQFDGAATFQLHSEHSNVVPLHVSFARQAQGQ